MAVEKASGEVKPATYADTLKICLYGKYGSRKTLQIGSLIDLVGAEHVLVISAERGLNTIKSKLTVPENVIVVESLAGLRSEWTRIKAFAHPAKWIAVDGASSMHEWIANEQLSGADNYYDLKVRGIDIPSNLLQFGRFITDGGGVDAQKIYGRIGRESENLLNSWIKLPANLYFDYLEDLTGNSGREKSIPYGPDCPGKVGLKAIMSSFDFVMRLTYDAGGKLVGGLDATSRLYLARTREDRSLVKLPSEIVDFELGNFVRLLCGEAATGLAI